MRTIEDIKALHNTPAAINKLSVCYPVDHLWAMETMQSKDYNDFYTFLIVTDGRLMLSVNYHELELKAYDLLMVKPRELVRTCKATDDFAGYCLSINESSYNGMLASDSSFSHLTLFIRSSPIPVLHCPKGGGDVVIGLMDQLCHLMVCAVTNVYIDKMMMLIEQSLMLQIVNIMPENYENDVQLTHQEEVFRRFIEMLIANYREHHDSRYYSDRLNVTNSYLARILRNTAGRSVKDFIADMLTKDAKQMLCHTDMQISDIAHELGFADNAAFSKFFKRYNGCTPQSIKANKNDKNYSL